MEDQARADTVAEATQRIEHKALAFRRLFVEHPDGKYVLLSLKAEFLPSVLFHQDPMQLAANAAYRDVFDYIDRMCRFKEMQPHVADTELLPERG
jgi:hypothetical protein